MLRGVKTTMARYVLGELTAEDFVNFAHSLLDDGIFTPSLGRLATISGPWAFTLSMVDVAPLFQDALGELGLELPSEEAAARFITAGFMEAIYEGSQSIAEVLSKIWTRFSWGPLDRLVDGLRIRELMTIYHQADFDGYLVSEGYRGPQEHAEVILAAEMAAKEFALGWLERNGGPDCHPCWQNTTVLAITNGIYADRAFDRLPILADALEDAGCTNAEVLEHCRQPPEHVRGCWVVDLLLGKG